MYNTNQEGGFAAAAAAAACPASRSVRVPQAAFETMWDARPFDDRAALWPEDGSQPFVWSYGDGDGDGVGYGTHGDALQRAMDSRALLSDGLAVQSVTQANRCTVPDTVDEDNDGCRYPPSPFLFLCLVFSVRSFVRLLLWHFGSYSCRKHIRS